MNQYARIAANTIGGAVIFTVLYALVVVLNELIGAG